MTAALRSLWLPIQDPQWECDPATLCSLAVFQSGLLLCCPQFRVWKEKKHLYRGPTCHGSALLCNKWCTREECFLPKALFIRALTANGFSLPRLKLCAAQSVCVHAVCVLRLSEALQAIICLYAVHWQAEWAHYCNSHFKEGTLFRLSIGPNTAWLWSLPIIINHTRLRTNGMFISSRLYNSSLWERNMPSYGDALYSRNAVYSTDEAIGAFYSSSKLWASFVRTNGLILCTLTRKRPILKHVLPSMSTSWWCLPQSGDVGWISPHCSLSN